MGVGPHPPSYLSHSLMFFASVTISLASLLAPRDSPVPNTHTDISAGVKGMSYCAWFYIASGDPQIIMFAQQELDPLSHLPSPG